MTTMCSRENSSRALCAHERKLDIEVTAFLCIILYSELFAESVSVGRNYLFIETPTLAPPSGTETEGVSLLPQPPASASCLSLLPLLLPQPPASASCLCLCLSLLPQPPASSLSLLPQPSASASASASSLSLLPQPPASASCLSLSLQPPASASCLSLLPQPPASASCLILLPQPLASSLSLLPQPPASTEVSTRFKVTLQNTGQRCVVKGNSG